MALRLLIAPDGFFAGGAAFFATVFAVVFLGALAFLAVLGFVGMGVRST
jgi:hypothetical protein